MARRVKRYAVSVMDAEGVTHDYFVSGTSRRRAEAEAKRYWEDFWGASVVECKSARQRASGRRLLAVAGTTFAVAGVTITATMAIALSLQGAV